MSEIPRQSPESEALLAVTGVNSSVEQFFSETTKPLFSEVVGPGLKKPERHWAFLLDPGETGLSEYLDSVSRTRGDVVRGLSTERNLKNKAKHYLEQHSNVLDMIDLTERDYETLEHEANALGEITKEDLADARKENIQYLFSTAEFHDAIESFGHFAKLTEVVGFADLYIDDGFSDLGPTKQAIADARAEELYRLVGQNEFRLVEFWQDVNETLDERLRGIRTIGSKAADAAQRDHADFIDRTIQ